MLALIAGAGELPGVLAGRLTAAGTPVLICEPEGVRADVPADLPRLSFRLETLGTLIGEVRRAGASEVCMAGAVRRPAFDPARIDAATRPLVPRLQAALGRGDDGALRELIAIFEEAGLRVAAAHEIAPDLLPPEGVLTRVEPTDAHRADAALGETTVAAMGEIDLGQACVVRTGQVLAREEDAGTDAMLATLGESPGALLFKAPKPRQDRRADLPVIGSATAQAAVSLGFSGIVIEAGGVMVMDRDQVIAVLDRAGLFLWVRPKGGA